MTQSINYEAVCRTAPATPGLLIINRKLNDGAQSKPYWEKQNSTFDGAPLN